MRKSTHLWQLRGCFFMVLAGFGGVGAVQARIIPDKAVIKPVAWEISGKVTSEGGDPLPGVTVLLKGTTTGTATGIDGSYSLSVPESGGTLIFSFIGYTTQERNFTGPTTINVRLADDAKALQEVVVTGYGTQQKSDITGAVASVKGEELARQPTPSIAQALQGRAAGVQITSNSGAPGASSSVRIRGVSSVNNVEVLYVVDGVQVQGNINYLNSEDIASIEVLKDASASAIYGSRAAGGVIIVTTKKGKANSSLFNFSAYQGIQNAWRQLDMTNAAEYAELDNTARRNANLPTNPDWANPSSLGEGTNWQKELFRTAAIRNYQVAWGGGSEKSQLYISGSYFDREGIVLGSDFKRYTFRLNTDHQVGKRFKVGNSLQLSSTTESLIPNNENLNTGVLSRGLRQLPTVPVRNPDGSFAGPTGNFQGESENPVWLALESFNTARGYRAVGSIYGDVDIYNGLSFRSTFNIDAFFSENTDFNPAYAIGNRTNPVASLGVGTSNGRGWQWSNILSYKKTFGNHSINALAGIEAQDFASKFYFMSRSGFLKNKEIQYLNAGAGGDPAQGGAGSSALYSQLARVNYDFANKYLVTATIRRDGSSKFANYRYGVFPSASLGWRISEENFFKAIPAINTFMIRAGYGEVGNQSAVSNYPTYPLLQSQFVRYSFGDVIQQGYYPERLANPNIRWETVAMTNIGIDAGVLDNRLTFTADYFIKNTYDMIQTLPIPSSTGALPAASNVGKMFNKGFEFSTNFQNSAGDFNYGLGLNLTVVKNRITDLQNQVISTEFQRTVEGRPIAQFYGYIMEGIFRSQEEINQANAIDGNAATKYQPSASPGDVRFKDVNGDGQITGADQDFFGTPLPKLTGGLNGNMSYKNFDFNFLFNSSFGNQILNRISAFGYSADPGNKFRAIIGNTWTPENPDAKYPRLAIGDPNENNRPNSSRWLESGTFVRLKNFQLGYNFAPAALSRIGGKTARIYLSGENVLTWTKYKGGFDPEQGSAFNNLDLGVDRSVYPQSRTFLLGINVGF